MARQSTILQQSLIHNFIKSYNYSEQSSFQEMLTDQTQPINTHRIQMLMLATLHVSAWACLIRSDYNFVFIFFAYFYLVSRKDVVSISILFYLIIGLCVLDLFFFLFVPSTWMAYEENNIVWNNLHALHGFAIFCSFIIFGLKLPIIYYLFSLKKTLSIK